MNLAEKLVSLRKQKGLNQLDLAERMNVSRQAISRWEVGSAVPSTDNLKYLSELYGVSVDYLLNDHAEEPYQTGEKQKQAAKEDRWKSLNKKWIGVLLCVIGIIVAIVICVADNQGKNAKKSTPLNEMDYIVEDYYPAETFHLIKID